MNAYTKQFAVISKGASAPDETTLDLINTFTLDTLTNEDVVVRDFVLAHNGIDRDQEILDPSLLADIAASLVGKGVFVKHPMSWDGDSGPGEGLVFATRLEQMSHDAARQLLREPDMQWAEADTTATLLHTRVYFIRTPENEALLKKMAAGIARFVSLGFSNGDSTPVQDGAGNTIAYRLLPPGQGHEMSLVWLGAQQGARATKGAGTQSKAEDIDMDLKERIKQLEDELKTSKAATTLHQANADFTTSLRKALGTDGEALSVEQITTLVTDGRAYKADQVERVVKAQRLLGIVGDSDEDAVAAKAAVNVMPVDQLKTLAETLEKSLPQGSHIKGGDPATGAQAQQRAPGEAADPFNPIDNPAVSAAA